MSGAHVFVSAWNDSGGGYLARLLDGHPALSVYPFELQMGTGLERCGYDEWFPAKYRWPVLPPEPRDAFGAFANEELRAAIGRDASGKFAGFGVDLDLGGWRKAFEAAVDGRSDRGHVVAAWLETFFESWRDGPSNSHRTVVGHCPVLALDWELVLADMPDARMMHVVRSPFASFADTKRRRPGMSAEGFVGRWSLVNTVAALHAARRPDRFRVVRYEDLVQTPRESMMAVATWLGLEFDDALLTPMWNGRPLADMKPFGGIPVNTAAYERANIAGLGVQEREILRVESACSRALFSIEDPFENAGGERENFTGAVDNLSLARIATKDVPMPLEYETEGDFWGLLHELGVALLVTREYEHLLILLGGNSGGPWQSAMPIPHPSGAFVNPGDGSLVVSSTRTPNQILWFRSIGDDGWAREIVPADLRSEGGTVYLPSVTRVLPGTMYIHDVVMVGDAVYVTVTGHNFVARIDAESGWERVWWPRVVDQLGTEGFRSNWLQLNSIGLGPAGLNDAHLTAFSDETSGPKPWREGYGPEGRGVVFSADSREVVLGGLTCPHSATRHNQTLWLCDSGFGVVGRAENLEGGVESSSFSIVTRLPGFTRGLAFVGGRAIVGLSKVIDRYEPYAPGVEPSASRCGIAILDAGTGVVEAQLWWPNGFQIYEVQTLPGVTRPTLPSTHPGADDRHLRFLG